MAYRQLVGRGVDADAEAAFLNFQAGAAQVRQDICFWQRTIV